MYIINMKGIQVCNKFGPDICVPIRQIKLSDDDHPRNESQSLTSSICNENVNLENPSLPISKRFHFRKNNAYVESFASSQCNANDAVIDENKKDIKLNTIMSIKNKKLHDVQLDRYNHKEEKKEYCKKNQFVENIIPRKQQKYENKRIDITSNNYPFEKETTNEIKK